MSPKPRTAVVIATKGRPQEVSQLLDTLAMQTVPPDVIVVSTCDRDDIAPSSRDLRNVEVLFGPPGLTAQRNRGLDLLRGKCDIVIFFDDDFIPSCRWIEHVQMLLAKHPDVVCVTGQVLADGVKSGGLEWSVGQSRVDEADVTRKAIAIDDCKMEDDRSPYGCNMAFRASSIEHLTFDERLVLYGWLEDLDFGFRAAAKGRMVGAEAVWGVHLGINRGRVSGLRFGYSQVINPWYLAKKGSMTRAGVCRYICRAIAANSLGLVLPRSHVDRWGRLKGNLIGIGEIMSGRWRPERITEL